MNELTTTNRQVATQSASAPSVAMMLQGIIEKGVTAENVSALEQIAGLYERMEEREAGQNGPILGDAKFAGKKQEQPTRGATKPQRPPADPDLDAPEDDIPF